MARPVLLATALIGVLALAPTTSSSTTLGRSDARLSAVKYTYRTRWCGSTYFKLSLARNQRPIINGTVGAVNLTPFGLTLRPGLGVNPRRVTFKLMDASHPVMLHLLTCVRSHPVLPAAVLVSYSSGKEPNYYTVYTLTVKKQFWRTKVRQPWQVGKLHHGE